MDISIIKDLWKPNIGNINAGIELWNRRAEKFSAKELPTAEDSLGMRIIQREKMVWTGSKALDIGCGGGRFSFALEAMGAGVTATDFSPEMIKKATDSGKVRGSTVNFLTDNWHTADLTENNWVKQYDLVLAHMTPAVVSADTFLKLIKASRGWVLMVKPTRRSNSVLDKLNRLLNVEQDTKALDETLAYAFALAWNTGGFPRLEYEEQLWENSLPLEEAIADYTLRISSAKELSKNDEEIISGYLKSASIDGSILEKCNTTIAAMYWHVK